MLITKNGIENSMGYSQLLYRGTQVYWEGFIFIRGLFANTDSIKRMIDGYLDNKKITFDELCGSFGMVLQLETNEYIIFNDNSCMHSMFVADTCIGNNILEVSKYSGYSEPNDVTICEYLSYTRNFLCESFVCGISAMDNLCYYTLSNGAFHRHEKDIGDIDALPNMKDPMTFFKDLNYALSNHKYICALTGGYDSRTVATVMNYYRTVPCFISGDKKDSPEMTASMGVAKKGHLDLQIINQSVVDISEDSLRELLTKNYNYKMRIGTNGYRISNFYSVLEKQGYEVILTGDAGDMHKDFWFRQDFPHKWSRHSRPERFLSTRVKVFDRSPYWGEKTREAYHTLENKALTVLNDLSRDRNAKSCLMYGWYFDWVPMMLSRTYSTTPVTYAPLQEIDLIRYSYAILPKGKTMNYFERKIITTVNPEAAKAITEYGTTSSSKSLYIIRDYFVDKITLAKQFSRGVRRKLFRQNIMGIGVNTRNIGESIRTMSLFQNALLWAQKSGYINKGMTAQTLPDYLVERVINIYYLFEVLKG